ncbi:MAG: NAD-dependent epimerase/dehydratase family protein [Chthoniobacterales bacterium]|nr:NAD-dependent epimerase/dehydratase family protein [Chthoniobacterales bacterium]
MILITGASGFIGSHICLLFEKNKIPYTILKRQETQDSNREASNTISIEWPEGINLLDLSKFSSILYLTYIPICQSMSQEAIEYANLLPISLFIDRIKESNPACHLLFISSQSAISHTASKYGKIKLAAENLIKKSEVSWTILRPGLVIGASSKGLFSRISTLIRWVPIIPLVGTADNVIQPVYLSDIGNVIMKIVGSPESYAACEYNLASSPIKFHDFLRKIAISFHLKRLFLPLPKKLVYFSLLLIEHLWKNAPVTTTNLLGFLDLRIMPVEASWNALKMSPTPLGEALKGIAKEQEALNDLPFPYDLEIEAKILFKTLFSVSPSTKLIKRYLDAHQMNKSMEICDPSIKYILSHQLDIEAVELAIRPKKTILTKKLLMLTFLAEIDPITSQAMVNEKDCRFFAFASLFYFFIRSIYKKVKGHFLLWRHPKCMTP